MTAAACAEVFPHIDAAMQECITDEQARFFMDNGLLVIRNVVRGQELKDLQDQMLTLVEQARAGMDHPDYMYRKHEITGERVPHRIEYVIEKTKAGKALLGHPFILRTVEKLQGRNFIPTWDSMVFKNPGAGVAVPWHRDAGTECCAESKPIFNVDFYLDESNPTNCLWGIPGSNTWTAEKAGETIQRLNQGGFHTEGTVPIYMKPGDVILHNILALHGSKAAQSTLRRVLYYEFRPGEVEREKGPHVPAYIAIKQKVLLACLRDRANSPYSKGEKPFVYDPEPAFAPAPLPASEQLKTYRYPHNEYWRKK